MDPTGDIDSTLKPREIDVPSKHKTFEAQVVIITQPRKETVYPYIMPASHPMEESWRVIDSGKFHAKLILSELVNGKPTLMITEDEHQ